MDIAIDALVLATEALCLHLPVKRFVNESLSQTNDK